jgi:hypothetical protein
MRSERAQGTVEYVGVLLVVAVLLVGLAGAVGATGVLGGIFTGAIESAFEMSHRAVVPEASAAEQARFADAIDPTLSPEDRPSLGDLRLELIERHGDERGRAIYRELIVAEARRVVPGLAGTTRFGSLGPTAGEGSVLGGSTGIQHAEALVRATEAPQDGDPGELETPIGPPDVHVVTTSEQDAVLRALLHPGVDTKTIAEDIVGAVPVVGNVERLSSLAFHGVELAATAATLVGAVDDARQAGDALSPGAKEIGPGLRAGDIVVGWMATRRNDAGTPLGTVARGAVVRDGRVIQDVLHPSS